jgi:hypothetical protein
MLNRIEATYLGLLRVVILIVASLALIGAALALVSAAPPVLRLLGIGAPAPDDTGTLGNFIAEKKLEGIQSEEGTASPPSVQPDIAQAAKDLQEYLARQGAPKTPEGLKDLEGILTGQMQQVPSSEQDGYAVNLKGLTGQLLKSKGKPLNPDRLDELIAWHRQHFVSDRQADAERKAADAVAFGVRLRIAAGAFVAFILVVFVFLFVKVERSLRLVRTVRADGEA